MQTLRGQARVGARVGHRPASALTPPAVFGWTRSGRSSTRPLSGDTALSRAPAPRQHHHRHAPLAEAASTVADTKQQVGAQAAPAGTFNWARQWYPMLVVKDLDPKKPVPVTLMGRSLVVWNDGKAWHCSEDRCPHRLAPLSEGRIEKGQLMCCYHGWTFDGSGKCTNVPQITDPKAQETACASPRNCVTMYPCKEVTGLLWVWGEGGPQGAASSAKEPVPTCALEFLLHPDASPIKQRTQWFMRDLPIRADTLLENALDPSHVPFAHHGVQGSRKRVVESTYTVIEPPELSQGFKIKQTFLIGGRQREGSFGFKPPALIDYNLPFGGLHVYVSPTKVGWCRIFATFSNNTSNKMPLPFRLFTVLMEGNPAIEHPVMRNKVLDGDTYMLHVAERDLLSHDNNWQKQYYMPANADTPVLALREWLGRYGGNVPTCSASDAPHMPPPMTKRQVLDRYSQHTVHCKSCMQTLRNIDAVSIASVVAAAVALFTVVARVVVGSQPLLQAANGWAAAGIAGCMLLFKLLQGFREKFFYEEYEHAYAD